MHPTRTRSLALAALCSTALLAAACGGGGGGGDDGGNPPPPPPPPPPGFDRNALLGSLAQRTILPTYRDFAAAASALSGATTALATATASDPAASRADAQTRWRDAMAVWQRAELYQIGPAGSSRDMVAGQDLRDALYSWPTTSACRVDEETAAGRYDDAGFFESSLVNVRGLDALEYLLFVEGTANACPPASDLNAAGTWNALAPDDIRRRRAAYAAGAAADVAARAATLLASWEPSGGNFAGLFADAGRTGSPYPTAQEALDDTFAGLFYLELRAKDDKLAVPAGISPECATDTCPDARESRYANASLAHVARNLEGFERGFLGGNPGDAAAVGFDDYLVAVGAADLAAEMTAEITAAKAAVAAIDGELAEALANDLDAVVAAHDAVKALTDDLKSRFVAVLNLRVPSEGAGDND